MIEYLPVVLLAVVWILIKDWQIAQEREAWTDERRELLTRIQHPEVVPFDMPQHVVEERDPDEMNLVGTVIE